MNIDEEEAIALAEKLEKSRCKARARILRALCEKPELDYTEAAKNLGMTSSVLNPLVEQGVIRIQQDEEKRFQERSCLSLQNHKKRFSIRYRKNGSGNHHGRCLFMVLQEVVRPRFI